MTNDPANAEPRPSALRSDREVLTTRDQWIESFGALLGVRVPDPDDVVALLAIAGEAARGSERTAAPIACFLAGRSGAEPGAILDLLRARSESPPAI